MKIRYASRDYAKNLLKINFPEIDIRLKFLENDQSLVVALDSDDTDEFINLFDQALRNTYPDVYKIKVIHKLTSPRELVITKRLTV